MRASRSMNSMQGSFFGMHCLDYNNLMTTSPLDGMIEPRRRTGSWREASVARSHVRDQSRRALPLPIQPFSKAKRARSVQWRAAEPYKSPTPHHFLKPTHNTTDCSTETHSRIQTPGAMASASSSLLALFLLVVTALLLSSAQPSMAMAGGSGRRLMELYRPPSDDYLLGYEGAVLAGDNGALGDFPVSILWYGRFTPAQKAVVTDFLFSLAPQSAPAPSVSQWWSNINQFYLAKNGAKNAQVILAGQVSDEACSLGKRLKLSQLPTLAAKARQATKGGVALVLTADDVEVESFCVSKCGTHGASSSGTAYAWVANSAVQFPGKCVWPFHQLPNGLHAPALAPPNGDVGMDGVVINVASVLAGVVTSPFYQGDRAVKACPGVYGKDAYPGYAGELLVDKATGASYNANGEHGRKYLLPALFDPDTATCARAFTISGAQPFV